MHFRDLEIKILNLFRISKFELRISKGKLDPFVNFVVTRKPWQGNFPDEAARPCYNARMSWESLPGYELIQSGVDDLSRGVQSIPALLVSIGASRLRRLGMPIPESTIASPEHRLFELLQQAD